MRFPDTVCLGHLLDHFFYHFSIFVNNSVNRLFDDPLNDFFYIFWDFGGNSFFDDLYFGNLNDSFFFNNSDLSWAKRIVFWEIF